MENIKSDNKQNTMLISRKEAIKKAGLSALTAATIVFLSTKESSAQSDLQAPGRDFR